MRVNKLHMGTRPNEQLLGTYPFGKNGIVNDLEGAIFNEPGFDKMAAVVPYQLMGKIETDANPVLFSTDNVHSAIGYFDTVTGNYLPIVDDAALGFKLGFNINYYITGQAQRNYKGEQVIAFTDKNIFPKYLNCDNPVLNTLDDFRLFPVNTDAVITINSTNGGLLAAGTYYVVLNYERKDGTTTGFSEPSTGFTIGQGVQVSNLSKALLINIANIDQDYDYIRVSIISKINGLTNVVQLSDIVTITSGTATLIYDGSNTSEVLDIREVLTPFARYDRVGTIGQLNDALYIGELHEEPDINDMQQYANLVKLQWSSVLVDATAPSIQQLENQVNTFMHGEVYACYIRYHKTRGGFTKSFVLSGETPISTDLLPSTEASTGGGTIPVQKFQVEDTIHSFSGTQGDCGVWQNATEVYPNTIDFDSTSLGGRDLRNQPVLHHKMPTIRWCQANLYSADAEYGKTKLDLLGLIATNITIPSKYNGEIDGYEILYAKRNLSDMTVYGQGLLLHGIVVQADTAKALGDATVYTSGANWQSGLQDFEDNLTTDLYTLRRDTMRFHAFDILLNKPEIAPDYISAQFRIRKEGLQDQSLAYLEDGWGGASDTPYDLPTVHLIDYTIGNTPTPISAGNLLKAISNSFYLPNNLSFNKFINTRHEYCFAAELLGSDWALNIPLCQHNLKGSSFTLSNEVAPYEECYIINLLAVKQDVYKSFTQQVLISTGNYKLLTDSSAIFGGDSHVSDYTFHTYGRYNSADTNGDGYKGRKVVRRFVCESASNIALRYSTGTIYSEWYPVTAIGTNNPANSYVTYMDRSIDPNQFGYNTDLNALNDLVPSTTFNPVDEVINDFPYRIHRGGKLPLQAKPRNWRTFLTLDYYEMQKNMGKIINLHGMDDRLIIHMENALFRTQDKAKLESGILSITLGAGDIFQFEPQQAISAKLGYAGTIHDLSCIECPYGYVFVDGKQGEIFMLKGELQNIGADINLFLRQYLKITATNPFNGNGIAVGYDQKYKRVLLSIKNYIYQPNGLDTSTSYQQGNTYKVFFGGSPITGDIVTIRLFTVTYASGNFTVEVLPGWTIADVQSALMRLIRETVDFTVTTIDATSDNPPGLLIATVNYQIYSTATATVSNNTAPTIGNSFTLSYSMLGRGWAFFHDYFADTYITTRQQLFSASINQLYRHNTGLPGNYYDSTHPFFIDMIFHDKVSTGGLNNTFIPTYSELLLQNINWNTEYLQNNGDQLFNTLTHLSIWNSNQHSGRIDIRGNTTLTSTSTRKTKGQWVFNNFRNILTGKGQAFLLDLFHDFLLDTTKANPAMPWHKKEIMQDTWFCVRFEYDNLITQFTPSISASAILTITGLGPNRADNIVVYAQTTAGFVVLGAYTKQVTDTTVNILTASIASVLAANPNGYTIMVIANVIIIKAPNGTGAGLNGLQLLTQGSVVTEVLPRAFLAPNPTGTIGTPFITTVDDPLLGTLTLSTYIEQAGDFTNAPAFIANLITNIRSNTLGYTVVPYLTYGFYIVAPIGTGTYMKGALAIISFGFGNNSHTFDGGTDGAALIPNTTTLFSGGIDTAVPATIILHDANVEVDKTRR